MSSEREMNENRLLCHSDVDRFVRLKIPSQSYPQERNVPRSKSKISSWMGKICLEKNAKVELSVARKFNEAETAFSVHCHIESYY